MDVYVLRLDGEIYGAYDTSGLDDMLDVVEANPTKRATVTIERGEQE